MISTIFAKKMDMTGKWSDKGRRLTATVLELLPMKVKDLRNRDKHGYEAVRLDITNNKSQITKEVRTDEKIEAGTEIKIDEVFKVGDRISVAGISKGHGFAGPVKRHGFAGGPRTHGQSDRERAPGSSGSGTTPGRVYKGKRRAGRMGNDRVTIKGLQVLEIDVANNKLVVSGSVPGKRTGLLEVKKV